MICIDWNRRFTVAIAVSALALMGIVGCGSDGEQAAGTGDGAAGDGAVAESASPAAADPPPPALREGWPTEEQAKAAIFKVEYAIQASQTNKDVWHVKDMTHEVHSVKFAKRTTEKQMHYGDGAITVYPAKILYLRTTEYTDKPATHEELGEDGVWLLYQDSFGEWTGKYGTE